MPVFPDLISEKTLGELRRTFVGKAVKITHTETSHLRDGEGVCVAIHPTEGRAVDVELENGHRWGFVPTLITDTYIEGPLVTAAGRRKVQLA